MSTISWKKILLALGLAGLLAAPLAAGGCYDDSSDYDGDGYIDCYAKYKGKRGALDHGIGSRSRPGDDDGVAESSSTPDQCDCNDLDSSVHPGAEEVCGDGVDQDCDGSDAECDDSSTPAVTPTPVPVVTPTPSATPTPLPPSPTPDPADQDGDGHAALDEGGDDCDDTRADVNPDAADDCDGVDNDCDGVVDQGYDGDGDGFSPCGGESDCDDGDEDVNPGATEVCDGKDNNCDDYVDEGVAIEYYRDADYDGYGNPNQVTYACSQPSGYVEQSGDCNDGDPEQRPGYAEYCDGKDNDCNGVIDSPPAGTDSDGDGYTTCVKAGPDLDCDDTKVSVHPDATEVVGNGIDDDCDGAIDESPLAPPAVHLPF